MSNSKDYKQEIVELERSNDKRPDPKPRKRPHLWQMYLIWSELVELRKRHILRISSIERGKSNLDAEMEYEFLSQMALDENIKNVKKAMCELGAASTPIVWTWLTGIRGLGEGNLVACLVAQIDDIAKFDTISKLWRFSGYAVIDGKREYANQGKKLTYNRSLKSIVYLIGDMFIKQRTGVYRDVYDKAKEEYQRRYPEPVVVDGKKKYTKGHIDYMARRKMVKLFLSHLWTIWRESEGLPVTKPYVESILGHENIIKPYIVSEVLQEA